MDVIFNLWERPSDGYLHIFVGLPGAVGSPILDQVVKKLSEATRGIWSAITITAVRQGKFGGKTALEPNRIFELDDGEPVFLTEFREKLRQPRWIDSDTVCLLFNHIPLQLLKIVTELYVS